MYITNPKTCARLDGNVLGAAAQPPQGLHSASHARGGPQPCTALGVQRLPSGKACFLWKNKRLRTPGVLLFCQVPASPQPYSSPCSGWGHPRLSPPYPLLGGWHVAPWVPSRMPL